MGLPVGLRIMQSSSFPSGMGRYYYDGSYEIIVQNLSHEKEVCIWASNGSSWRAIPAKFIESLPDNFERWEAVANEDDTEFMVKYVVNGATYWDNNNGQNYKFPAAHDELNVITGHQYPIVLGTSTIESSKLRIHAAIQNITESKIVGLVYTTDHWATNHTIYAQHHWTMVSGMEVWLFEHDLNSSSEVEFALFYQANGCEYWDNNFGRNYIALQQKKSTGLTDSESSRHEMWNAKMPKVTHHKAKKSPEASILNKMKIAESQTIAAS